MNRRSVGFGVVMLAAAMGVRADVPSTAPATAAAGAAYQLVWQDEFSKDGDLNPADWSFEQGFVRNEEEQWYQPQNAQCVKGHLVIKARREEVTNPRYRVGSNNWKTSRSVAHYTSASASTRGHHSWLYGRFEMRARIDVSPGSWPAFWTLGTQNPWPACGEVDIMEFYRGMLLANIGWGGSGEKIHWNSVHKPLSALDPEWSSKFHTWRMDWDADRMVLSVDDQVINSQDLSRTLNGGKTGENPFHHPAYLIVNQAIGGQQGGDPSHTTFPLRYEIDYVRVYQTPEQIKAQPGDERK